MATFDEVVNAKATDLILKRMREYSGAIFNGQWPSKRDLDFPKFHVSMWKQFCEVFMVTETKVINQDILVETCRQVKEKQRTLCYRPLVLSNDTSSF